MITVTEARAAILSRVRRLGVVRVALDEALGRVLALDVLAADEIPPFANSAMDGFAVVAADTRGATSEAPVTLAVVEDVPAGTVASRAIGSGTAARIMTGAPLPPGADAVVPVESTTAAGPGVAVLRAVLPGANVRAAGEDVRRGDVVVPGGTVLRAAELGALAAIGTVEVDVIAPARVAVVTTGDELVAAGTRPGPGQIRDSNVHALVAQVRASGGVPVAFPRVPDREDAVVAALEAARRVADVIVTNGAVSVGDYDFVKPVLALLGAELVFWGVAQKPGKPLAFWMWDGVPVFGVPGNPVSAMVCFEEYVRPALRAMMGHRRLHRPACGATLRDGYRKTSADGRVHFVRVFATPTAQGLEATVTGPQGSGILSSMTRANALAVVPAAAVELPPGAEVTLHLVDLAEDR